MSVFISPRKITKKLLINTLHLNFQAAVGWEYEGKTEAHVSQKGL